MSAAVIMMAKTGRLTLTSAMFMDALLCDRAPRLGGPPSRLGAISSPCVPTRTVTPVASWLRLVVASDLVALQAARDSPRACPSAARRASPAAARALPPSIT